MFSLIPDDVFIIIALPNVGNTALLLRDDARHGGFVLTDDRTQRSRNGQAEIFDVVRRGTPWRAPMDNGYEIRPRLGIIIFIPTFYSPPLLVISEWGIAKQSVGQGGGLVTSPLTPIASQRGDPSYYKGPYHLP
jgi:hypothetical protein